TPPRRRTGPWWPHPCSIRHPGGRAPPSGAAAQSRRLLGRRMAPIVPAKRPYRGRRCELSMPETTTPIFPPGRYGRRRAPARHRRLRTGLMVVLLAGVIAVTALMAYRMGQMYGPGRPYDVSVLRFYDITDPRWWWSSAWWYPRGRPRS